MRRREFVTLLGGTLAAAPFTAYAENSSSKIFRITVFPQFVPQVANWFSEEMRAHGWTEGRDLIIEQSGSQLYDLHQLDEAAQRVVAGKPDLIVTYTSAHAAALQQATKSIPIVMVSSGYPVEAGIADSLSKPGRNVTGNALYAATGVWSKMLQLLHDAKPTIERVGILWTYVAPPFPKGEIVPAYAELERGARLLGLKIHIVEGGNPDRLQGALSEIEAGKPDGLMLTSLFAPATLSIVTQFAVNKGLPTIIDFDWAPFGLSPLPLMSYGPVFHDLVRRAAVSIDKIMRGTNAGDIPIQNPDRFEMIINVKTAQAIGLSVPDSLLAHADKVNE